MDYSWRSRSRLSDRPPKLFAHLSTLTTITFTSMVFFLWGKKSTVTPQELESALEKTVNILRRQLKEAAMDLKKLLNPMPDGSMQRVHDPATKQSNDVLVSAQRTQRSCHYMVNADSWYDNSPSERKHFMYKRTECQQRSRKQRRS